MKSNLLSTILLAGIAWTACGPARAQIKIEFDFRTSEPPYLKDVEEIYREASKTPGVTLVEKLSGSLLSRFQWMNKSQREHTIYVTFSATDLDLSSVTIEYYLDAKKTPGAKPLAGSTQSFLDAAEKVTFLSTKKLKELPSRIEGLFDAKLSEKEFIHDLARGVSLARDVFVIPVEGSEYCAIPITLGALGLTTDERPEFEVSFSRRTKKGPLNILEPVKAKATFNGILENPTSDLGDVASQFPKHSILTTVEELANFGPKGLREEAKVIYANPKVMPKPAVLPPSAASNGFKKAATTKPK